MRRYIVKYWSMLHYVISACAVYTKCSTLMKNLSDNKHSDPGFFFFFLLTFLFLFCEKVEDKNADILRAFTIFKQNDTNMSG